MLHTLPFPFQELKTKVIKKTLNPTFNESFQFKVSAKKLEVGEKIVETTQRCL